MKRYFVIAAAGLTFLLFSCGSAPTDDSLKSGLTDGSIEAEAEEGGEGVDGELSAEEKAAAIEKANSAGIEKVDAARQEAIEAGAEDNTPEQLAKVDELYAEAKRRADAGEDMTKGFAQLTDLYTALAEYSKALAAKERIDAEGYQQYDKSNYARGEAALEEIEALLEDDNATSAQVLEKAHLAWTSYNRVLLTALKSIAQEERKAAFIAKRNADGVYAAVSRKADYNAAVKEFRAGDSSYATQNPEKAAEHYIAAKEAFIALYADIGDKMAEAETAIREAQEASASSEEYARKADMEDPLEGDDIEGIEEHDAVLLEDLEYDDPEESIEVIPGNIDDMDEADEVDEEGEASETTDTDNLNNSTGDADAIESGDAGGTEASSADESAGAEKLSLEDTEVDDE